VKYQLALRKIKVFTSLFCLPYSSLPPPSFLCSPSSLVPVVVSPRVPSYHAFFLGNGTRPATSAERRARCGGRWPYFFRTPCPRSRYGDLLLEHVRPRERRARCGRRRWPFSLLGRLRTAGQLEDAWMVIIDEAFTVAPLPLTRAAADRVVDPTMAATDERLPLVLMPSLKPSGSHRIMSAWLL